MSSEEVHSREIISNLINIFLFEDFSFLSDIIYMASLHLNELYFCFKL